MDSTATTRPLPDRLVSLDAYRGLTMLAMASGGLGLHSVAENLRAGGHESQLWSFIGYQFEHVEWVGCSLWDLIQPSFMFIVGVAMAYSCAHRLAQGQTYGQMLRHAVVRAIVLVLLGVFLRSDGRHETIFTFEDVLSQIGLGYVFLFLLWNRPPWLQFVAAIAILAGYWYLFYAYPLPGPEDYAAAGLGENWPRLEGIAAHWDKNTNAAAAFDRWFLNLFPRSKPFTLNGGGYMTLSFIPSLATMIFGLLAGGLLRSARSQGWKFGILVAAGLLGLAAGMVLQTTGVCPIVKRIWTPSWALFSTGWVLLILAAFYGVVDVLGYRKWTFPLVVAGMNSITMYVMADLSKGWLHETLQTHFGARIFDFLGPDYRPFLAQLWILLAMWLICYWLYRQRIFVRI
jgi:heparan-alpha-glucosaminide N-acetyltransferase